MKSGDILVSKYRLVQRIGEGAMGEVWSGENLSTGRKVALKLIIRTAAKNNANEIRQRMLREARACGKLAHRNIVQILDVGEMPEGDPFLVLELLRGRTLSERLKDTRRMQPTMAARIGADIANALAAAHSAKIIHRDLKPANIFLHHEDGDPDDRFVVKVLDFGVSKSLDGTNDGPLTVTNMAVGSPVYMSPEQVSLYRDLDGQTDIWSLGVVLFEMLTGGRPFTGGVDDVVRQIILTRNNKVPAPSTKVRDVSPDFDAIVLRCLENDRARRYTDAGEVARGLMAIAEAGAPIRVPGTLTPHIAMEVKSAPEAPASEVRAPTPTPAPPTKTASYTRHGTEPMPRPELLIGLASTHGGPRPAALAAPTPVWRSEMAAWRAKREADATRNAASVAAQSAIQTAADVSLTGGTNLCEPTGTTSSLAALSQPDFTPQSFDAAGAQAQTRKRNASMLYALMGAGVVIAFVLMGLILALAQSPGEPPRPAVAESTSLLAPDPQPPPEVPPSAPRRLETIVPVPSASPPSPPPNKTPVVPGPRPIFLKPTTLPKSTVPKCTNSRDPKCAKSARTIPPNPYDYSNKINRL